MTVDKSRCHNMALGVDLLPPGLSNLPDGRDSATDDRHIRLPAGSARAIDHCSVPNDEVIGHETTSRYRGLAVHLPVSSRA
jgi:hypothetical protein